MKTGEWKDDTKISQPHKVAPNNCFRAVHKRRIAREIPFLPEQDPRADRGRKGEARTAITSAEALSQG